MRRAAGFILIGVLSGCQFQAPRSYLDQAFNNVVRQSEEMSCGAAAVATYITYVLRSSVTEEDVVAAVLDSASPTRRARFADHGLSLADLYEYGRSGGYRTSASQLSLEGLRRLARPVIVHLTILGYEHFAVVRAFRGGDVYVADPSYGNLVLSERQFAAVWTDGVILLIEPRDYQWPRNAMALQANENLASITAGARGQQAARLPDVIEKTLAEARTF